MFGLSSQEEGKGGVLILLCAVRLHMLNVQVPLCLRTFRVPKLYPQVSIFLLKPSDPSSPRQRSPIRTMLSVWTVDIPLGPGTAMVDAHSPVLFDRPPHFQCCQHRAIDPVPRLLMLHYSPTTSRIWSCDSLRRTINSRVFTATFHLSVTFPRGMREPLLRPRLTAFPFFAELRVRRESPLPLPALF